MSSYPTTFTLETVLGCNLRCPECAVGGGLVNRKYGQMSMDQYHVLAGKIRPHARYVYLHLWGEPLLNRDIFSMVRHAGEFARTNLSTNANLLDPPMAREMIQSGVTDIIVSIDGLTQPVYEAYRRRGDAGKAIKGLTMLAHFNARRASPANIIPQFIVFEHNVQEKEAFGQLCKELGLTPSFKAPYLRPGSALKATALPGLFRETRSDPKARAQAMRGCPNMQDVLTVHLDGRVVACCYDHNGATGFGNLFTQSVEEIWDSPACKDFRRDVQGGRATPFCAQECLLY